MSISLLQQKIKSAKSLKEILSRYTKDVDALISLDGVDEQVIDQTKVNEKYNGLLPLITLIEKKPIVDSLVQAAPINPLILAEARAKNVPDKITSNSKCLLNYNTATEEFILGINIDSLNGLHCRTFEVAYNKFIKYYNETIKEHNGQGSLGSFLYAKMAGRYARFAQESIYKNSLLDRTKLIEKKSLYALVLINKDRVVKKILTRPHYITGSWTFETLQGLGSTFNNFILYNTVDFLENIEKGFIPVAIEILSSMYIAQNDNALLLKQEVDNK